MAELVDALASGASNFLSCGSSSLLSGTLQLTFLLTDVTMLIIITLYYGP